MGLRYRKSINLGGGFRVNFSKSGVGYSWGMKGYRVTKKAGGGVRKTYSIPGTGLSWVDEGGNKKKGTVGRANSSSQVVAVDNQNLLYQAEETDVKQMVTDNSQDFIEAIKKYSRIRTWLIWGTIISLLLTPGTPFFVVLFIAGIAGLIYLSAAKKINVEYEFDDYGMRRIQMMDQAMISLINNNGTWQVNTIQANSSTKTNAGASRSVEKKPVKFMKKKPFFLKTDATCYYIKLLRDDVYILPDRLIVKGKKGWGVVEYSEMHIDVGSVVFIESGAVPKDAEIVGYTWQYVNKNGSPDKRYSNNRQLPKCNYGTIAFKSATGLNVILYISNINNARQFSSIVKKMIDEAEKVRTIAEQEKKQIQSAPVQPKSEEVQKSDKYSELTAIMQSVKEKAQADSGKGIDSFVLADANAQERILLEKFWNGLLDNNLPTDCKSTRLSSGTINVEYKGTLVGSINFRSENAWMSYPIGNSGKIKKIEGTAEELCEKVSNWLRFIMNYL